LESIRVELRLGDRVRFLGAKYGEDLNGMIARAKSVILSSAWYENMPYVLLESLLAGKIVIAARIGGIPERIRDGENGLLFEAGNAHALAEKIRSLENIDIVEMSDKARESVSDLSPEQYAESLEALYLGLSSKTIDKK
jgi:glycosyltransferase involved in cell wall biosynthesis